MNWFDDAVYAVTAFFPWVVLGLSMFVIWLLRRARRKRDAAAAQVRQSELAALPSDARKKCPFCAEEIHPAAIKCKHCGEMLESREKKEGVTAGQVFGAFMFVVAIMGFGYFCIAFDTSVPLSSGGRVNNLGLMQEQRNWMFACALFAFLGLVLARSEKRKAH